LLAYARAKKAKILQKASVLFKEDLLTNNRTRRPCKVSMALSNKKCMARRGIDGNRMLQNENKKVLKAWI
jgi:hypothetical protein